MNQTTLANVEIPFFRLVGIIIKFILASIPAMIFAYVIFASISVVPFMIFGGVLIGSGVLEDRLSPATPELPERAAQPQAE